MKEKLIDGWEWSILMWGLGLAQRPFSDMNDCLYLTKLSPKLMRNLILWWTSLGLGRMILKGPSQPNSSMIVQQACERQHHSMAMWTMLSVQVSVNGSDLISPLGSVVSLFCWRKGHKWRRKMKHDLTYFLFKYSLNLCGKFPDLQFSLQAMYKHMPNMLHA